MRKKIFSAKKIAVLSVLTALSLITFLIENLLPPLIIPGAKLGLANTFSFIALIMYSPVEAFVIVAIRTLLGAIFAGNLSALMYSFTGGVVAMTVSSVLLYCAHPRISVLCVSVVSAVFHNLTQNAVFVIITATPLMFTYAPYLVLLGVLSGGFIGCLITLLVKRIPTNAFVRVMGVKQRKTDKQDEANQLEKRQCTTRTLFLNNNVEEYMKAIKGKPFFSGIHVKGKKDLSCGCETEVMPAPAEVYISTAQSLGKPALACVEKGQKVKEGELIAKADGAISSNVFASVAGEVTDMKELVSPSGRNELYIVVKNDGSGEKAYLPPLTDPTAEEIKARINDCGIVGLGGAGFPTAVKVAPRTPVDTLILNGAECEPYLTCDHRLMIEHTDEIVRGARLIAKALDVSKIIIGIEKNKPDAIAAFEQYDDIQPVVLKKQYPMGSEKHLIYCTTGRKVGLGKLPADSGVVVQNVGTAFAVCEAVEQGKPLYERVLTVSGGAVKTPKNLWVKLGTPVEEIVTFCGGESEPPKKIVQGGPMTGVALASYEAYTHKTTSGILLMTQKEAAAEEPTPCLNCGKCADVCPMHLMPMNTAFYAEAGDFEAAGKYGNTLACIECGACEFICPAKRPLIQAIRKTKAALRNKK